jgi:hypothetical protein
MRIGIAADHGSFDLEGDLRARLGSSSAIPSQSHRCTRIEVATHQCFGGSDAFAIPFEWKC